MVTKTYDVVNVLFLISRMQEKKGEKNTNTRKKTQLNIVLLSRQIKIEAIKL